MDWNTFFSALSQSAAAIVGIFGAFLLSKTLNNQSAFIEKCNKIKSILADCQNLEAEADGLQFERYNDQINNRIRNTIYEMFEDNLDGALEANPYAILEDIENSPFQTEETTLNIIKSTLTEITEKLESKRKAEEKEAQAKAWREAEIERLNKSNSIIDQYKAANLRFTPISKLTDIYNPFDKDPLDFDYSSVDHSLIEKDYDAIVAVERKIEHQCLIVENFLETINGNPESSTQITWATILTTILFFIGVIYPVSFMPVPQGTTEISISLNAFFPALFSFKGVLLTVVSAFFLAIPATFIYLNNSLKYKKHDIERLARYKVRSNYSEYFGLY